MVESPSRKGNRGVFIGISVSDCVRCSSHRRSERRRTKVGQLSLASPTHHLFLKGEFGGLIGAVLRFFSSLLLQEPSHILRWEFLGPFAVRSE